VAAAGMSLLACQSADADTITVSNPNVNVGFAGGDVSHATLNIGSLALQVNRVATGIDHLFVFTMAQNKSRISLRGTSTNLAVGPYGKKFSQIGTFVHQPNVFFPGGASTGGAHTGFSQQYFAFSFTDSSSQTHYGWIYGSLTGGYSDFNYNLISYGYDTTPNVEIGAGYTGPTPEPSTGVMFAMAALVLGAAGVRKRNKAQA
jgi:hypothetical protein